MIKIEMNYSFIHTPITFHAIFCFVLLLENGDWYRCKIRNEKKKKIIELVNAIRLEPFSFFVLSFRFDLFLVSHKEMLRPYVPVMMKSSSVSFWQIFPFSFHARSPIPVQAIIMRDFQVIQCFQQADDLQFVSLFLSILCSAIVYTWKIIMVYERIINLSTIFLLSTLQKY